MHAAVFLTVTVLLTATGGTNNISVNTKQSVSARCGDDVVLKCVYKNVIVISSSWAARDEICENPSRMEAGSPNMHCNNTDKNVLVLTIRQAQPSHSGNYTCKLEAGSGHALNQTSLTVSECQKEIPEEQKGFQTRNKAWIPQSKWINLLFPLMVLLVLVLDSRI